MTVKMIAFLLLLIIIAVFSAFNLSNTSDISFGFYTLKNVPIFLSLLVSFIAGAIMMLPFTFIKKRKLIKETVQESKEEKKVKKKRKKEKIHPEIVDKDVKEINNTP